MLVLSIDHSSAVPAYRQICDRVIALVEAGDLVSGDRLPPSRILARMAGVHRSTVLRAYGELWSLGYLQSRPGSYSTIRRPVHRAMAALSERTSVIDWDALAHAPVLQAGAEPGWSPPVRDPGGDAIDFATLAADSRMTPIDDLRRCMKAVMLEEGRGLLDYGDAHGHPALREMLVRRMRVHGIDVTTDEVMITNGAQHGLDLVLRLLTVPGAQIVVECPTYAAALPLFRLHALNLNPVSMLSGGLSLDALSATLERHRPALVYTMPAFHNPTGISTSHEHRERLLSLCETHGVPLVEDGFEEDMKYFGKAALPIKSMDRQGVVVYLGTLSKVIFSGLRIGWIAAPRECIRQLVAIHRASSISGIALVQAAAARFCDLGLYDAHLRRVHASFRKRMQVMLRGLETHMPEGVQWTRPAGGSTLWVTLNQPAPREPEICERLLREGIRVTPGRPFFATVPADAHFRLSIASVNEAEIAEGCRRLGRALATI